MLAGGPRPFLDTHRMRAASGTLGAEGALLEGPPTQGLSAMLCC